MALSEKTPFILMAIFVVFITLMSTEVAAEVLHGAVGEVNLGLYIYHSQYILPIIVLSYNLLLQYILFDFTGLYLLQLLFALFIYIYCICLQL